MSSTSSPPASAPLARLRAQVAALESGLLERDTAVRLMLLATLAGEHVLLIGPPGTAKSELARRLHAAVGNGGFFERLLTRFSTPEELFGPLSLKALEDDRYERLTDGYLPTASVAFLDEVFKANSAILNALLTLLNEREFDNGCRRLKVPLISVVGASNEVPAEDALLAFHDRFLVRIPVIPVGDATFADLLHLPAQAPFVSVPQPWQGDELAAMQRCRDAVELPASVVAHLAALRAWLRGRDISVSDRRWRQLVGLLRTAAASEGRAAVEPLDLWLVPYVVATLPAQVAEIEAWFIGDVAQAARQDAPWLTRAVEAFEKQLQLEEQAAPEDGDDQTAGKLALARAVGGSSATHGEQLLRIVGTGLETHLRRHYSPVHIAARLAQLDEVRSQAQGHADDARGRLEALESRLDGRIWLPPTLGARMLGARRQTLEVLQALLTRLDRARAGFAALPVDDGRPALTPEPVALSA